MAIPAVGDIVDVWWTAPEGGAKVRGVWPYSGRYPEYFTHVIEVDAPNTRKGSLRTVVDARTYRAVTP
jgi:hypothetical protein